MMNLQINLNKLSHIELEFLSDLAEDYLFDRNILLTSHSYRNIIIQAAQNGFTLPSVLNNK